MNTGYLLPCSCGEKIPIETRQAGQTITCACGMSLEVPTMLQMKQLERRVEPESREVKRRRWGVFESMALLGLVIVLSAIVGGIVWFIFRPQLRTAPSADNIRKSIESLPPQAVWREWHMMRTRGLNPNPIRQDPKYPDWYRRYRIGWGAILAIGVLGLALTVTMLSLRHRVGRARPPSSS